MNINNLLISLLRSKVVGGEPDLDLIRGLSAKEFKTLYDLSLFHEVAHIVGAVITESGVLQEASQEYALFRNEHMLAVFRYRRLADELSIISELFEREGVAHIALKGSVLRDYYPEPWMRTSCDIDILVKREQLEQAKMLLVDSLGYTYLSKTGHDLSLESATGVHLELHFALIEDYILKKTHKLLSSVWDSATLVPEKKYTYAMTDEFFYFYHILHMAKHFLSGGCGIRGFIDLWILKTAFPDNSEKRESLILKGGLASFERTANRLLCVWFDGAEHDEITLSFERFVFSGGAYGTVEGGASVGVARKRSRLKYIMSKVFLPYKAMENMYPALEKRKYLLPFYHIKRWCRIIFKTGSRRGRVIISTSKNISSQELDDMQRLLDTLEIC